MTNLSKALRDQLYSEQKELLAGQGDGETAGSERELVPAVVDPEVIWACTTCRWCERSCPLDISYVDKIVEMRQNLVLEKAEFPEEAQPAFRGYEVNGNPWQLPAEQRGDWAQGLGVPLASEAGGDFEWLFFVGSPGSYDDHGKKVSQALVKILKAADVSFAILGPEEASTGDAARRLGRRIKFLVGKPGLDGHSNGAEQISSRARDVGMDITYEKDTLSDEFGHVRLGGIGNIIGRKLQQHRAGPDGLARLHQPRAHLAAQLEMQQRTARSTP